MTDAILMLIFAPFGLAFLAVEVWLSFLHETRIFRVAFVSALAGGVATLARGSGDWQEFVCGAFTFGIPVGFLCALGLVIAGVFRDS